MQPPLTPTKANPKAELYDLLRRAATLLDLEWPETAPPAPSRIDDRFLTRKHVEEEAKVPFFPEVHQELRRSWKAPYTARVPVQGIAAYTNVAGIASLGYTTMPPLEDSMASHLCPLAAPRWKSKPLLPSKPCRITSSIAEKAYITAGQAGAALNTMAVLQAYQAEMLKRLAEGEVEGKEDTLDELRRATDLALRATKCAAQATGRTMSNLVVLERHLWLNLTQIQDRDKSFLLDAPLSPSGLFGEAIPVLSEKYEATQKQSAAYQHMLPRRQHLNFQHARQAADQRGGPPPHHSHSASSHSSVTGHPSRGGERTEPSPRFNPPKLSAGRGWARREFRPDNGRPSRPPRSHQGRPQRP